MSGTAAPATGTSLEPGLAQRWRRWRRPLAVVAFVLAVAVALGIVASGSRRGYLDPEGVDQTGARAVVRLLQAEGVEVVPARTAAEVRAAARGQATVLVTVPALLGAEQVESLLGTGADLVLVAPGPEVSAAVPQVSALAPADVGRVDPGCDLPEAVRAGSARTGGITYAVDGEAQRCYPVEGEASVVVLQADARRTTVLGAAAPLTNRYLDEDGNASLALGLLGRTSRLVWYRPVPETGAQDAVPLTALLPGWTGPVAGQLLVAAALAALWRARRLGRVVTEPLPAVVRSAESTEGRARLYRRGRAREHAASALRASSTERLRGGLALPRGAPSAAVVAAVAERTGRAPTAVDGLLAGPAPPDDRALVALADSLDTLEQEVLHP